MNNTTIAGDEAKRTRRLLILGVLLIVAAVAITANRLIHSRMQQARLMQDRPKDLQWGTYVYSPATAAKAQTQRQTYLAKANLQRDHWRVWALAHQGLLRQLRQAPPNDTATLMRVYSALPSVMDKSAGVTLTDIGVNHADFIAGRGVPFTWQPEPVKPHLSEGLLQSDPHAQAASDHYDNTFQEKLKRDFANYHDIMLSESMSAGRSRITLWADGRITEMTRLAHPALGQRDEGPEKEIVPPYDFLK